MLGPNIFYRPKTSVYGGDKCRMQDLQPHNDCMHAAVLAAEKERRGESDDQIGLEQLPTTSKGGGGCF